METVNKEYPDSILPEQAERLDQIIWLEQLLANTPDDLYRRIPDIEEALRGLYSKMAGKTPQNA